MTSARRLAPFAVPVTFAVSEGNMAVSIGGRGDGSSGLRRGPAAPELGGRDVAAQAEPAVLAIERLARGAVPPSGRVGRDLRRPRLGGVAGRAVVVAVAA